MHACKSMCAQHVWRQVVPQKVRCKCVLWLQACSTIGAAQMPADDVQSGLGVALQAWGAVRAGPMHALRTTCRAGTNVSWYHRVVRGPSVIWVA